MFVPGTWICVEKKFPNFQMDSDLDNEILALVEKPKKHKNKIKAQDNSDEDWGTPHQSAQNSSQSSEGELSDPEWDEVSLCSS